MLFRVFEVQEEICNQRWIHYVEADSEADAISAAVNGDVEPEPYGEMGEPFFGESGFLAQPCAAETEPFDRAGWELAAKALDAPRRIIVTVSGGVVQGVENVPPGVVVEIHDYDVEGADPEYIAENLRTDENGDDFLQSEWSAGGAQ